jgi:hypothetical protein
MPLMLSGIGIAARIAVHLNAATMSQGRERGQGEENVEGNHDEV